MNRKRISIITPCYNAETLIEETIQSIFSNSAFVENSIDLEYIICDGGSTDQTLPKIDKIFARTQKPNLTTKITSEKDSGMYEALSKGLRMATGDIIAYLNAGDFYSPYALEIVSDIFNRYPVRWLTGLNIAYNHKSQIVGARLPFRYCRNLIPCGFHNEIVLPHIQQESTFWGPELHESIDYNILSTLRFAGDFYLWKCFSQHEELFIIEAWLGGFKFHHDQLSSNMKLYNEEMHRLIEKATPFDRVQACLEKVFWNLSEKFKKRYNRKTMIVYNRHAQKFMFQRSPIHRNMK